MSLPMSFLSLVLASVKLFYSQRLGIFSEPDPCFLMTISVLPLNALLISGPLFTLILVASYHQISIVFLIMAVLALNWVILKKIYFSKDQKMVLIREIYNNMKESGTKEASQIFYHSVFTSWISPCTVWVNNNLKRSKFLITTSLITSVVHTMALITLAIFLNVPTLDQTKNSPVVHCFKAIEKFLDGFQLFNKSQGFITICDVSDCNLPRIRICDENELPSEFFLHYVLPVGMTLNLISLCAGAVLQKLGNISNLKWKCQRLYFHKLNDYLSKFCLENMPVSGEEKDILKEISDQKSFENSFMQFANIYRHDPPKKVLLKELKNEMDISGQYKSISSSRVWTSLPPMHWAAENKKWVLWCFLNVIGGEGSAKNGQNKTSINIIIERKSSYATPSFPANYWIEKVTQKYGPKAIFHAIIMNDLSLLELLAENGYNLEKENENHEKPLYVVVKYGKTEFLKII